MFCTVNGHQNFWIAGGQGMAKYFGRRACHQASLAFVGLLCLVLSGCGGGGSSATGNPSAAPPTQSKTSNASAILTWDAPNQDMSATCINVASYHIGYGTSSSGLTQTVNVPSSSISCTNTGTTDSCGPIQSCTYSIANLPSGTWYFDVSVTDTGGQQSGESPIVSTTLP